MRFPASISGAAIALTLLAAPAAAAPFGGALLGDAAAQTTLGEDSLAVQVQYRRSPRGGPPRGDHRGGGGRGDDGAGVAAGILGGLLLGAIIANEAQRSNRSVEYCMRRFRSYDPRSGTYLGYDGYRHRCP